MRTDHLNDRDRTILLEWFLYYMPMESGDETKAGRQELMREYPQIYNRLCRPGGDIVKVVRVSDGTVV